MSFHVPAFADTNVIYSSSSISPMSSSIRSRTLAAGSPNIGVATLSRLKTFNYTSVCCRATHIIYISYLLSLTAIVSERNHNIRIPGFASDETRISLSQTAVTPAAPSLATNKKGTTSSQVTLRSHRLAQVAQAKREAKLL